MPLITEIIPSQGFEVVTDQIGAILTLELANQKTLQGLTESHEVFNERTSPYDKAEDIMVNVLYDNSNYDNGNQASVHAPSGFFIDVYGHSPSTSQENGDHLAAKAIKKYVGMCRYILASTKHSTLLLPPGTIGGVYVEGIQMYDVDSPQDAKNVRMARMSVKVRIYEGQDLWEATTLTGNDTGVKLAETDKGYKYELTT